MQRQQQRLFTPRPAVADSPRSSEGRRETSTRSLLNPIASARPQMFLFCICSPEVRVLPAFSSAKRTVEVWRDEGRVIGRAASQASEGRKRSSLFSFAFICSSIWSKNIVLEAMVVKEEEIRFRKLFSLSLSLSLSALSFSFLLDIFGGKFFSTIVQYGGCKKCCLIVLFQRLSLLRLEKPGPSLLSGISPTNVRTGTYAGFLYGSLSSPRSIPVHACSYYTWR